MSWEFIRQNVEALVLMLSSAIMGGVAQYLGRVRHRHTQFSMRELALELVISAAAGITAGLLVVDVAPPALTYAACSVAGHMGTRFWFVLETLARERLGLDRRDGDDGDGDGDGDGRR